MTYRDPAFMTNNLLSAITDPADIYEWSNTNSPSNTERRRWLDGRQGTLGTFSTTGTLGGIRWDFGSIPGSANDTLIVPAGHDLDGETVNVFTDSASTFASATNYGAQAISGAGVYERDLSAAALEQWFLFRVDSSSAAETFTLAGWWMGEKRTLSGSAVDPGFGNGFASSIKELDFPNGVAALELAPPRRRFSLRVRDVDPSSDDYATLSNVLQSRATPFWYWPPDDVDAGPFYVRLDEDGTRVQEFPAPANGTRYEVELAMTEDRF